MISKIDKETLVVLLLICNTVKQTKILFFFLLAFLFVFAVPVFAQLPPDSQGRAVNDVVTESIIPPYPYPTSVPSGNPIFGQDHSYSVVMRGNGEAVVTLKVTFSNVTTSSMNKVYLRVPKVEPREVMVYQIYKPEFCLRYLPNVLTPELPVDYYYNYYNNLNCEQWSSPDYFGGYLGDATFYKARTDYSGDTLTVYLPKSVRPDGSGSFFVYYRAFGYAKKNIVGAYNYTFETLKANESIRSMTVGISVDSDLFLKDAKGGVNYRFEEASLAPLSDAAYGVELRNPKVTSFVSQIGSGTVTKTASNLAALESYSVKGVYADRQIKLYGKEILWGLLVVVLFLAGCVFFVRAVYRRLQLRRSNVEAAAQAAKPRAKAGGGKAGMLTGQDYVKTGLVVAVVTFFSPLLMMAYTFALVLLTTSSNFIYFGSNYLGPILFIIILILSIAVYGVLLFFPALYVGLKRGLHWALATFLMTVFWTAFCVLIIVVMISVFNYNPRGPYLY